MARRIENSLQKSSIHTVIQQRRKQLLQNPVFIEKTLGTGNAKGHIELGAEHGPPTRSFVLSRGLMTMERRRVLQVLALGSAGTALGLGTTSLYQAMAGETGHHWGYVGEVGPDHWGELSPEFQVCGLGREQSPIDLQHPVSADLSPLTLAYQPVPLKLINNGHTIQVNIDGDTSSDHGRDDNAHNSGGNTLELDGKTYPLKQFHFHHPSEHTISGAAFPMEIHFVHIHDDGSIAVLGVFIKAGAENPALQPIWEAMPFHESEVLTVRNATINPSDLLPSQGETFRYFGSLTTPPCSEIVSWLVFQTPIEASQAQIDQFGLIFAHNARPVQPQNRRLLLESI